MGFFCEKLKNTGFIDKWQLEYDIGIHLFLFSSPQKLG